MIGIERVYTYRKRKKEENEYLVLVDRLWPRGIRRDEMPIDEWLKEVSPSHELRKWFGHEPEKWEEFMHRYQDELNSNAASQAHLKRLWQLQENQTVTLLYSAKDEAHNQAEALRRFVTSGIGRD
jgi:uncharacterized protein YeaO (DUF488 family)